MSSDSYVAKASAYKKDDWGAPNTHPKSGYGREYAKEKNLDASKYQVDVGDGHTLWVQEYGNPNGEPVIYLHGGPGGGCQDSDTCFFDPQRYRIILFDQRGCGNSIPTLKQDFRAAFVGNNTAKLVEDIDKIRDHLGIKGKMHLMGGSWGTTLGLAYAIKHPEKVKSLTMRGVFLGSDKGMKYLFQGNAATYNEWDEAKHAPFHQLQKELAEASKKGHEIDPNKVVQLQQASDELVAHFNTQDHEVEGAYRAYVPPGGLDGQIPTKYWPEHKHMAAAYARSWDEYVRLIPRDERTDMPAAYVRRLEATTEENLRGTGRYDPATNTIDPAYQQRLAFAFAKWEGAISNFCHVPDQKTGLIDLGKFEDPDFAVIFARTEARYMLDGLYLTEDGRPSPGGGDYLTREDNLKRMAGNDVQMFIAHGEQDQVCPVRDAHEFKAKYEAAGGPIVHITIPAETGHSRVEIGNAQAVKSIMDNNVPQLTFADKIATPDTTHQAQTTSIGGGAGGIPR